MVYRGRVKNDVVMLEDSVRLPEGASVQVTLVEPDVGSSGTTGRIPPSVEDRFRDLISQWKEATAFTSSTTEIAMHSAYQQIIGMGREVLPLLFAELRERPAQYFWALKAITGEDPVALADRGKIRRMSQAWLDWASRHGY
jgi:hypothetical protein